VKLPEKIEIFRKFSYKVEMFGPGSTTLPRFQTRLTPLVLSVLVGFNSM